MGLEGRPHVRYETASWDKNDAHEHWGRPESLKTEHRQFLCHHDR
jgi:hypothetical protein